jgi:dolichol-phosphate mannosyltransferase
MRVVIVVCTYNERDNTEKMLPELDKIIDHIGGHEVQVLYVDDTSPDGTADVVKDAQKKYKWLHLLAGGQKQGLGMAYARGMAYAMAKMHADYLMEFDADFQHPPQDIPRLVAQIDHGYDYILASRYVKGGSVPADWTLDRKLVSFFGNLIARVGLLIPQVHDCTGGFKLSRVKGFMDEFDFSTLYSKKFAYKIHLLAYMVVTKKAKVKEAPFAFGNRTAGDSKYMTNEIKESLKVIWLFQLHNPQIQRFLKFGTIGFIGYVINAVALQLFTGWKFPGWLAWGGSTELAIISNFTWNNLWTFSDQKISGIKNLVSKFLQFNVTSTGALLIQVAVGMITDRVLGEQYRQIVLFLTIPFLILPYNFLMYTLVIWRKKKS